MTTRKQKDASPASTPQQYVVLGQLPEPKRSIKVHGSATQHVKSDQCAVTVTISVTKPTPDEAAQSVNPRKEWLLSALSQLSKSNADEKSTFTETVHGVQLDTVITFILQDREAALEFQKMSLDTDKTRLTCTVEHCCSQKALRKARETAVSNAMKLALTKAIALVKVADSSQVYVIDSIEELPEKVDVLSNGDCDLTCNVSATYKQK